MQQTPVTDTSSKPPGVLLAYMPMGLIQMPSLGLSLLKAGLVREGMACDVRYFNLEFVEQFCPGSGAASARRYAAAASRYQLTLSAEALFSEALFGPDPARDAIVEQYLGSVPDEDRRFIESLRPMIEPFLEHCLESVDWHQYRVVGCSTVFLGMTVPSVLLLDRLKRRFPHLVTVLGGPNTEGPMGLELARRFPQVDYVLRGEADESFPRLVRALLADEPVPAIPGLVQRDPESGEVHGIEATLVSNMGALPIPDFDDFIQTAMSVSFAARYQERLELPFESSRGCWWGQVSHCKFCGILGEAMAYRSKPPERLLDELQTLIQKHRPQRLLAADAILDHRYFRNCLPKLAEQDERVSLSYEIKANVKRDQVKQLAAAGVDEIQPGIETFSSRILKLIDKGSTSLTNLQCLRLAKEYGITVSWYHMCGLPGETVEDYEEELPLLRKIVHLNPPIEIAIFTLQRFTPYFDHAQQHGIADVQAMDGYRAVFPFDQETLDTLAYHFDFRFADGRPPGATERISRMLSAAVHAWKDAHPTARLDLVQVPDGLVVIDTRFENAEVFVFEGLAQRIMTLLDEPKTPASILRDSELAEWAPTSEDIFGALLGQGIQRPAFLAARDIALALGAHVTSVPSPFQTGLPESEAQRIEELERFLAGLASVGLVYTEDGRSLSLAVPQREVPTLMPHEAPTTVAAVTT